ncbi:MAG: radical SAM family heme chaperone HemW [Alphaproteobacteria bacterium]|nr:radical SAM family heme chaperone HemW [Alphaproteobacteria bacterium]
MEPLSIYFHWPYCKSKCPYCDFFSKVTKNVNQAEMIENYIKELDYYHELLPERSIRSIFFGGGTPSLIEPQYIEKLIVHVSKLWRFEDKVEISLEANPNSNHENMFKDLKGAGVNRLSLGVQALNKDDLKLLGRTHNLNDALACIEDVVQTFDNHSIDLIYARPHQNQDQWFGELEQAVSFGLKHLSLYQLTIEEGTLFEKRGVKAMPEDEAASMYLQTVYFLDKHGYPRYEVSNFALPLYESKHNKCYWLGDDYIGIGESAHGRLKLKNNHYALVYPHQMEELAPEARADELIIMGLRLQKGIDKAHFKDITGLDFDRFINHRKLEQMIAGNLLQDSAETLYATNQGFLVLDKIILELCS